MEKPIADQLGQLLGRDGSNAGRLVAAAADVTIVLDGAGTVIDTMSASDEVPNELCRRWVGRPFAETVTIESRAKIDGLLEDAQSDALPRWRHLNHPDPSGRDLPVLYRARALDADGHVVLLGREQRATAMLQQRLVAAQQSLERDYSRLRHVETRYRLLFQIASDPVLVVDAATEAVLEANPAATRRILGSKGDLVGRDVGDLFALEDRERVTTALIGVRNGGRPEELRVRLFDDEACRLAVSLFRQEKGSLFLMRMAPLANPTASPPPLDGKILRAVAAAPDGFVLTANDGRILHANEAFLELAQLANVDQAVGETLDRWIGRSGVDVNVLYANLRERQAVKLFNTELRGEFGVACNIEVSALTVANGASPTFAFLVRSVGQRVAAVPLNAAMPGSIDQLTELVGRVSLKDLVRETTDMIEKLYIEAALNLTNNNRASAAELLGLSRQSLYVKLHRYGLRDGDDSQVGERS